MIRQKLSQLKESYKQEGVTIVGFFGSYAKQKSDDFSDIDIAYNIDYDQFSQKFHDGFGKILRLEEMAKELSQMLGKRVDFVPFKEEFKEIVYV